MQLLRRARVAIFNIAYAPLANRSPFQRCLHMHDMGGSARTRRSHVPKNREQTATGAVIRPQEFEYLGGWYGYKRNVEGWLQVPLLR